MPRNPHTPVGTHTHTHCTHCSFIYILFYVTTYIYIHIYIYTLYTVNRTIHTVYTPVHTLHKYTHTTLYTLFTLINRNTRTFTHRHTYLAAAGRPAPLPVVALGRAALSQGKGGTRVVAAVLPVRDDLVPGVDAAGVGRRQDDR